MTQRLLWGMQRMILVLAPPVLLLWSLASSAVSIQGTHFVDSRGAKIIFRGFNLQEKAPPFEPVTSGADLDPLQAVGANLVRLNFIWEAAEPEPGLYNQAYFDYYDRVIHWAWERGMYVLIDFHNNAYSRFAINGCGAGFPVWALSPSVTPVEPKPNSSCSFSSAMMQAMLSPDNYKNWHDFMTDRYGVRTRFFALTRKLAEKYRDNPAVIGFDLNEPMAFKPILQFDSDLVNRFYRDWQAFIQDIDPHFITFWDVSPFQYIFINQPPRLDFPDTGNVALDAHFYEPGASGFGRPLFDTSPNINAILETRDQYQVPVLVGEYGANLQGNQNYLFQYQMDMVQRAFDQNLLSAARWNYSPQWTPELKDHFHDEDYSCFDDRRHVRQSCAPRPNVQVLSGDLVSLHIHRKGEAKFFIPLLPWLSRLFQFHHTQVDLTWNHHPEQGETRIFASEAVIFHGSPVSITTEGDDVDCHYDGDRRYVECSSDTAGIKRVVIEGE